MERVFYIGLERLLAKHADVAVDVRERRIQALCKGIVAESGGGITINFRFAENQTICFAIQGELEPIGVAVGLLERHLDRERRQQEQHLPEGVASLTAENLQIHNRGMMVRRQFTCQPCNHIWWRKVMSHKPVSKCERCAQRYDAVPMNYVFGWGRFTCPNCGNVFSGRAQVGVPSICHQCNTMVMPNVESIGPMIQDRVGVRRNRHACQLCDNGRIRPCPGYNNILFACQPHVSTGSTASTFLTQQSFPYREPLD